MNRASRLAAGARRGWIALGLLASLVVSLGCGRPSGHNLLLISVDTLRADRLSGYGYGRTTSPAIDRLLGQSVVFEDAQANSSWTLGSFASMLTSTFPDTNGTHRYGFALDDSFTTLAESLAAAGYRTAGIASHTFFSAKYGLQQGFAEFDDELVNPETLYSHLVVTSPQVSDKALAWLDERTSPGEPAQPWFLWVHYFDPHNVYKPHEGFSQEYGLERESDLYDGEVRFTDHHIGRLLDALASSGLADRTVTVLVADHGEEFLDHGGTGHGKTLYREVQQIPFAIRAPGLAARRVPDLVQGVDLMPTLLELLGVERPDGLEGRSLVPLLSGHSIDPAPVLSNVDYRGRSLRALIERHGDQDWKLIHETRQGAPGEQLLLFDRVLDPLELRDVAGEHPEVVARMRAQLAELVARARARADAPRHEPVELSPAERASLRALGYVE